MRILYVEAADTLHAFFANLKQAVLRLDPRLQLPAEEPAAIIYFLWYLLRSGVAVVIDEFQLLEKTFFWIIKVELLSSFLGVIHTDTW